MRFLIKALVLLQVTCTVVRLPDGSIRQLCCDTFGYCFYL